MGTIYLGLLQLEEGDQQTQLSQARRKKLDLREASEQWSGMARRILLKAGDAGMELSKSIAGPWRYDSTEWPQEGFLQILHLEGNTVIGIVCWCSEPEIIDLFGSEGN